MQHFQMGIGVYEQGDHRFYIPTGATKDAFFDCRDIAAMGHGLIVNPSTTHFHGGAYELTGPTAVNGAEIAEILSHIAHQTVEHIDGLSAFEGRCAELGKSDWAKAVYIEAEEGWFSEVKSREFIEIVGREPRSFAAWADDQVYWFKGDQ